MAAMGLKPIAWEPLQNTIFPAPKQRVSDPLRPIKTANFFDAMGLKPIVWDPPN